ncbi:hypothetical protein P872_24530 [Rhodonellum psychrophilum GCM71 = DSM 17998]|uniref:Cytochrome c domain-containing protein n=2 Tax=Rhodonellum TaxID=336827 RepID=U5C8P9_9BACT|nr:MULTISPECIES: c-type cytochrome domain-containing protein [Rhodonellum]ERM84587.1 hypothetical protein P872_24530 [Rhodonellum psychrophilum GCM71 = DSM 17998]SDY85920.1 Uncharacterized membrane protein [Rhodonellum ikkaensis]
MPLNSRLVSISENALIAAHGFILILIIGQDRIQLPAILEVVGRTHPLLLHFPIVLLLIGVVLVLFPKILSESKRPKLLTSGILLLGLLFSAFTVIAGLFLATESGYERSDIQNHQWTGILVFWLGSLLYWSFKKDFVPANKIMAISLAVCILIAGHLGASLTHGEDFLWSPLNQKTLTSTPFEEALAYAHVIQPILEQKCVSCHKASKKKGDLRLDEPEFILTGGENGPVIDFEKPENSLLLRHILLPLEDEDHMPPKGKMQLSEDEILLIQAWIKDSVHFEKKLVHFNAESEFLLLAKSKFQTQKNTYDFASADQELVQSLNNFYRRIQPIHPQSAGLEVNFYGKENFNLEEIKGLEPIKEQIVSINLSYMPLKEMDMAVLAAFKNLEKLNLNFTGIGGNTLQILSGLKNLRSLSLSGNPIAPYETKALSGLKQLDFLYLWNTSLPEGQIKELKASLTNTKIEIGFQNDGILYVLNPPIIDFDQTVFSDQTEIRLKHPIESTKLFYTVDNTPPDSSSSLKYEKPIVLEKSSTLRARAFAAGWLGSPEASTVFLKSGKKPDFLNLKFPPNEKYKGKGVETLFDLQKGDFDFGSGKWLGFQENPMDLLMEFDQPKTINEVAISLFLDESSYIFPPSTVEIWVRELKGEWRIFQKDTPDQPNQAGDKRLNLIVYKMEQLQIEALRLRILPIKSLPKWHPGVGQKGWVFIDEILLN